MWCVGNEGHGGDGNHARKPNTTNGMMQGGVGGYARRPYKLSGMLLGVKHEHCTDYE